MNSSISQERINHIKADLERYGKPLVCRKLGIHVETFVDLQLENSNDFSANFIELLSLKAKSLRHIFGMSVEIDASKMNTFDYLIPQNHFIDDLQHRIKNKCDIAIKISIRRREYSKTEDSYTEGGDLGFEYFWFTGGTYEDALIHALAFVADYHAKANYSIVDYFRGIKNEPKGLISHVQPKSKSLFSTVKTMLLPLRA
jgi:hypothetical protein